jgi:hypothetical protein
LARGGTLTGDPLVARAYATDAGATSRCLWSILRRLPAAPETELVVQGFRGGGLLAMGRAVEARATAECNVLQNSVSAFDQAVAGDMRRFAGDAADALGR